MKFKILAAIIIIAVILLAITHADVKDHGERGYAEEWNKEHVITGDSVWRKPVTIVVAATDSEHKERADYICNGTDDQVEINQAIQALPVTGGEVRLLDGTFYITDAITINKNYVTLAGQGAGTKISATEETIPTFNSIHVDNSDHVSIKNLLLMIAWEEPSEIYGAIKLENSDYFTVFNVFSTGLGTGLRTSNSNRGKILGCSFEGDGVGIAINSSNQNVVIANYVYGAGWSSITLENNSDYNTVSSNHAVGEIDIFGAPCDKNLIHGNMTDSAIQDGGTNTTLADNVVY